MMLLHCRAGFENDCAAEAQDYFAQAGFQGYINAKLNAGFVRYVPFESDLNVASINVNDLIFARQGCVVMHQFEHMDEQDRITPILQYLPECFGEVLLEFPETNEGKQVSPFLKKFEKPLLTALKKSSKFNVESHHRLHLFFLGSTRLWMGVSLKQNSSAYPNGILRLKTPKRAPSRSGLKLEEALRTLMPFKVEASFVDGCTAVDLGAAPGGWTHQLVRRGMYVYAIDNGPMDEVLMATNQVEHIQTDGFKYTPPQTVDLLVCDMVEQPQRVAQLMMQWLVEKRTRYVVFNLKLPMKKRYDVVKQCLAIFESQSNRCLIVRAKQLYHDREEITVCVGDQ